MSRDTIENVLRLGCLELAETSSTAVLDAQLLLSHVTNLDRLKLIVNSKQNLSTEQIEHYSYLISRRKNSEPVAYIIGYKEFWGLRFNVSPYVLVPRPETEILIESFLTLIESYPDPLLVCDLGTGSGCIAISVAHELRRRGRNFFVLAVDKSQKALEIARQNAQMHGLEDSIHFVCSSWASAIRMPDSKSHFDFVLSNPPYIGKDEIELQKELNYEPASALFSGDDGLDDYRIIISQLPQLLSPHGVFLGEFGYAQYPYLSQLVQQILPEAKIDMHPDLRKIPRVLELKL